MTPSSHEGAIHQATRLQQHDPRRHAHEDRSPERHQHEDHQHVGLARRQSAKPVRQGIAQQQAPQRDDRADLEGAHEDAAEDALVGRHAPDPAVCVALSCPPRRAGSLAVQREPFFAIACQYFGSLQRSSMATSRAFASAGVAAPSSGSARYVPITSERAPATSELRRRASAPASELSGSAPRSVASAAKASGAGASCRFQRSSATTVRGKAFTTSGFSIARLSSTAIGTRKVSSKNTQQRQGQ